MKECHLQELEDALSFSPPEWTRVYLDDETWLEYIPDAVGCDSSLFKSTWDERPKQPTEIWMFGKKVAIPRRQAMYGHSYSYSGVTVESRCPTPELAKLVLFHAQLMSLDQPYEYNGVLVNWYEGGGEYIGAHADDESDLSGGPILSYSFGCTRIFRIRKIVPGSGANPVVLNVSLPHGSCCVMGGRMQDLYQHELPKMLRVTGNRINMTVRSFSLK